MINFKDRVAIVTGAGNGLGRTHALALANRGARVVVNDFGRQKDGSGECTEAANSVVEEIRLAGGEAIANSANVADFEQVQSMVNQAMEQWGRVDILVNNAGILRDKSFSGANLTDLKAVLDVHLMGSINCCKAVWDIMKAQEYGRIVMTSSSSGLYGNFGQSSYGAAKMAVIGLMNTLVIEGAKYNIKVNAIAPTAATRMTEDVIAEKTVLEKFKPEHISAGLVALCCEESPNRMILSCGAGGFSKVRITETAGIIFQDDDISPESVLGNIGAVTQSQPDDAEFHLGMEQFMKYANLAK